MVPVSIEHRSGLYDKPPTERLIRQGPKQDHREDIMIHSATKYRAVQRLVIASPNKLNMNETLFVGKPLSLEKKKKALTNTEIFSC